jgi:hypothetical protein
MRYGAHGMRNEGMRCDKSRKPKAGLRCCDATVATLGLIVVLGGIFRQEITWFLVGP